MGSAVSDDKAIAATPCWSRGWRERQLEKLRAGERQWDMVVIGGGITGAGVLREAVRENLSVLLIEQQDFAWGTSSRSSKMVHGGLRYLAQGDFRLTREAVAERQRLLREAPGLVEPLKYIYPFRKGAFPGRFAFNSVLWLYDRFAGRKDYRYLAKGMVEALFPGLRSQDLRGATEFTDAVTDDSRLVMRVLQEGCAEGGVAINYLRAKELAYADGRVSGLALEDVETGEAFSVQAKVVVNATGAWADRLRGQLVDEQRVRPLRGSHLVIPSWRLPVHQALGYAHPVDGRFVFVYPWEGATVIGTTDLDHADDLDVEAGITEQEVDYILEGVNHQFPTANLTRDDIYNTWSGVRPIVCDEGDDPQTINPSAARRDHAVWEDKALVTVTGGKLTTFRTIALDVMQAAAPYLPIDPVDPDAETEEAPPVFSAPTVKLPRSLGATAARRLKGFYGNAARAVLDGAAADELCYIPGCKTLWAELRWAAGHEAVQHLDDLMLRRTRLGLLLYRGGAQHFTRIKRICQAELGWDDSRWERELERYCRIWRNKYSLPARS